MNRNLYRFKNRVQDFKINFKNKFKESKEKPKSKRKSFIIGFTTVVGIFSLTLFGPALSAVAKDIPKGNPKPTDIVPAPVPTLPPSKELINTGLSGVAASVCGLAITSGSFAVGVACGFIVVIGILQVQGK
ncbi:MAG: hypothetical protein QNK20_11795 [Aureibaculum sp.]|nr:hypothetical protein [Aureibaculum sp.]